MSLNQLAKSLFPAFIGNPNAEHLTPCRLFLSATDMKTRAITRHAVANNLTDAWNFALDNLKSALGSTKPAILRADWVIETQEMTWADFLNLIGKTRRNYFRQGLALDSDFKLAFTESELNGNSMLYKDGKAGSANCIFRPDRCDEYCQIRFGCAFPALEPSSNVVIFKTAGIFISADEKMPMSIISSGLAAGHREISHLDSEIILRLVRSGARNLANQVQKSGSFIYGQWACFDRSIPKQDNLNQFSSTLALLNVYETYRMGEIKIGNAINKAIKYGVSNFVKYRTLEDGSEAAYIVELGSGEIRLNGLGLALLALVKHSELMKTKKYFPLMRSIARGIFSLQKTDGSFVHVLNAEDFSLKEDSGTNYSDGEAVFGLLRLYSLTQEDSLLRASEGAFQKFMLDNQWQNHDHWLAYATSELTKYRPKREYFEFGINNFSNYLPFVCHKDIPFPTLLELMMASDSMLERMKAMPEMSDLLARVQLDDFYSAMEARAKNLLNSFFYPELAMFFKVPEKIVGSFFVRNYAFRVQIDDVEHFLSGLVAYRKYLSRRTREPIPSTTLLNFRA